MTTPPPSFVARRLEELENAMRGHAIVGRAEPAVTLALFAKHHLEAKAAERETSDRWLRDSERHLERAIA